MKKIGLIGAGQLGRMTIEEARKLLCHVAVLSPEYPSPAAELADETVIGQLMDKSAVLELAGRVDVVSYEIEHVSVDALRQLEAEGMPVIPPAEVLGLIQDKAAQKKVLSQAGLPVATWILPLDERLDRAASSTEIVAAAQAIGGFPVIQKTRRGGYDGRGVVLLTGEADCRLPGGKSLPAACLLERKVNFRKELAVMVAIGKDGSHCTWPCVEMVFDERVNMCDSVLMPAREKAAVLAAAETLALRSIQALLDAAAELARAAGRQPRNAGVFAVELFLLDDDSLLVNEIAPRPHNSGHVTMEACITSQFSQYYRILSDYPLGSTAQLMPAMMVNLLAEPDADGETVYEGLDKALAVPGVSVHLYGKRRVKPFRKMGHLTALGSSIDEAIARAELARNQIRIVAKT